MDRNTEKAWNEAARHALGRIARDREAEGEDVDLSWFEPETFGVRVASVRRMVGHSHATLREVTGAAARVLARSRATDPCGRLDRAEARAVRAVVVGYAFATHSASILPSHERAEAARLMEGLRCAGLNWIPTMEAAMRSAERVAMPRHEGGTVGFRFAWMQAGRGGAAPSWVAATGDALLDAVHPARAPVVARLWTPDGRSLDLRMVDGVLHRPVLCPGSWRPADVDALAHAAAEGTPWRDNPFLAYHADPFGPVQGAAETWPPEHGARTAEDGGRRAAALEACLARAGGLVVIDGGVYRRTRPPRLVVALTDLAVRDGGERRGPHLAWAIPGGPRSDVSQDTLSPFANQPLGSCLAPWLGEAGAAMAVSFPLSARAAAEAFLGCLAPALEHWHGKAAAPAAPVEVLDPDAFPGSHDALAAATEEVRALLDTRVSRMPRDTPFFDEAEALSPDDPADLATPTGWKEGKSDRAGRMAVAVVASLAHARRVASLDRADDWSGFSP